MFKWIIIILFLLIITKEISMKWTLQYNLLHECHFVDFYIFSYNSYKFLKIDIKLHMSLISSIKKSDISWTLLLFLHRWINFSYYFFFHGRLYNNHVAPPVWPIFTGFLIQSLDNCRAWHESRASTVGVGHMGLKNCVSLWEKFT